MNRGREDGREDSLKGRDQRSVLLRGRERKRERTRDEHRSSIRYIMWYIIANFSHRLTRLDTLSALPLFLSLSFSLYLFPSLPVLFFLYSRDSPFQNAYTYNHTVHVVTVAVAVVIAVPRVVIVLPLPLLRIRRSCVSERCCALSSSLHASIQAVPRMWQYVVN